MIKSFNHNDVHLSCLPNDIRCVNTDLGRFYFIEPGEEYPSITTVLKKETKPYGITAWENKVGKEEAKRILDESVVRGNVVHKMCELSINNAFSRINDLNCYSSYVTAAAEFDKSGSVNIDYDLFNNICDEFFMPIIRTLDRIDNVCAVEKCIYSSSLRIAGKVDCIAEFDGKLSVIDFKTKGKRVKKEWVRDYFMQCAGYGDVGGSDKCSDRAACAGCCKS